MANESLKFIFAGALTAMTARANKISLINYYREICRSFAIGFDLSEQEGDNIYTNGILENTPTSINGFGSGTVYEQSENRVKNFLDSFSNTSSLSDYERRTLAATVNSILFAYIANRNIHIKDLYVPIGNTLGEISRRILSQDPFDSDIPEEGPKVLIHPFTETVINTLLSQNNYEGTYREISLSDKSVEVDLVHYNWYDTTSLFAGPELDKVKDAENQYYYLSGRLFYDNLPTGFQFCDEYETLINTPTGQKVINILRNNPCIDNKSYVGPITGVKFYREFNDGPYSSGDFTPEIKKEFINFDKNKLNKNQYLSNFSAIYSFITGEDKQYIPIFSQGARLQSEGEYNLNQEYAYAPISTGIYPKYQIMRVGDVRIRSQCSDINCTGGIEKLTTGFKYALLEMDPNIWGDRYAYIRTNPPTSNEDLVKRGLNLSTGVYISSLVDGELIAARPDPIEGYIWYVGPPQLNESELPYFAFTESFQSLTFPNNAGITLYPALGKTVNNSTGDSSRSFSASSITLLNATDLTKYTVQSEYETNRYPEIKFTKELKPYVSGEDDIKKKVFGMGDFLEGKYTNITYSKEENAGYFYTGLSFSGYEGSEWDLISLYDNYKIGSRYDAIKYISGYTGPSEIPITKLIGHDNSGENVEYYYFDETLLPGGISVQTTGLNEFAQLPIDIENNSEYSRKYEYQEVENQRERYYRGPFASFETKFLYPNAKFESKIYNEVNGFPRKFKYKIRVREETVKELYCKFKISQGFSYSTPTFINVVRPVESNFGAKTPIMGNIFSNSTYNFDSSRWDINKVGFFYNLSLDGGVDDSYAPYTDSFFDTTTHFLAASGKNAETYVNTPEFIQGVLITGREILQHRSYSGNIYRASGKDWFSPKITALGLYHGFTGYDISGDLTYNYPLFNLKEGITDRVRSLGVLPAFNTGCVSYRFKTVPSVANGINNLYTKELNGNIFYSKSGEDPFFFRDMGGRKGNDAENQGGYHKNGIIGDNWISLNASTYGYYCSAAGDVCDDNPWDSVEKEYGIEALTNDNRLPQLDNRWFLIEVTPSSAKIHTRALQYNPMSFDYKNIPFTSKSTAPHNNGSLILNFDNSSKSFKVNLGTYFSKRSVTGSNDWYYNSGSGLMVGPFDRDVELFINSNTIFTGYNSLYINSRKMSDFTGGVDDGSYLYCGVPRLISGSNIDYGYGPYYNIRPLIYIPSGGTGIINFLGGPTGYVGAEPNSYINIRARQTLNESILDVSVQSYLEIKGSNYWLHNHNLINNGMEKIFDLNMPSPDIADLQGKKFNFITFSRTGTLFPIPSTTEFTAYKVDDAAGNESYTITSVEDFYKKKTAKENSTIYYSGWREGSKISFEFVEVTPIMDELPYESHKVIIPSGNCRIEGQFGYKGQADNTIFTEGVYLTDDTQNDIIKTDFYGPDFVSPVLKRIPQFHYPTGSMINPVLEAPSVMKQRAGTGYVTPESTYSGLLTDAPYNYNKLLWPALSDLRILNPDETLEDLPPGDGNTFLNSTILISASQGQLLPNGKFNPNNRKVYNVKNQYQLYDTIATDPIINSGIFLTSRNGTKVQLVQPESGGLWPVGTTLTEIISKLI